MDIPAIFRAAGEAAAAAAAARTEPDRPAKKAKKRKPVKKPLSKIKSKAKKHPKGSGTSVQLSSFLARPYQFAILPLRLFNWTIGFPLMNQDPSIKAVWQARKVPKGAPESSKVYARAVTKMLKSRQLFRRFLHRWRTSRLRVLNTVDCITLEPIKKPIEIVDWQQRTKTLFEAQTLLKDITERLLFHDGFFEDAQPPRNPMTNLPLTQGQILSVWDQISKAGIPVSTPFVLFRRARFDLERYTLENETFLKLAAFRTTMKDITHMDTQERMLDFIQYCYELESADCAIPAFKYALLHFQDHELLRLWQQYCKEFYEAHILYLSQPQKLQAKKNEILDKTDALLDRQTELVRLRISDMRLKGRRAPPPASEPPFDPLNAIFGEQLQLLNIEFVPGTQVSIQDAAMNISALLNDILLSGQMPQ